MTKYLDLRTKNSNKKQKAMFYITDITNQYSRKFLKIFNYSHYLGYKIKQVHNKPTGAYFSLIKQINNITKSEINVQIHTNFVKSGFNKTIIHANKTIGHINKEIQFEEMERDIKTTTSVDKDKQTSNAYDIKGKEKTPSTSEK